MKEDYSTKFHSIAAQTLFPKLGNRQQVFLRRLAFRHRFTMQELRQTAEIALDLEMWGGEQLQQCWPAESDDGPEISTKKRALERLRQRWTNLRESENDYPDLNDRQHNPIKAEIISRSKSKLGLGFCPVASEKTRCCNLLTLDAVDNCGYNCSYCSIQSFFSGNRVFFDPDFAGKLATLQIDPQRTYHIGTGQSSDSLMWGNSQGVLDALVRFARNHPNVILELKTKSSNVGHLLQIDPPPNLICTWSLNPQTIIDHEEQGSASLAKRIDAALKMHQQGHLIGFHFHPMIHFSGWEEAYSDIATRLQQSFDPEGVAMVSIGTLTFTKAVIRKIRERGGEHQILKMPLTEAEGKLSYPEAIKLNLFSTLYQSFPTTWKSSVFFYLCMENQRLWEPVFGHDYPTNDQFERAMKRAYMNKIDRLRSNRND